MATVSGSAIDSLDILHDTPQCYILNVASKILGFEVLREPLMLQNKLLIWILDNHNVLQSSFTQKYIGQ